jgi:hypothetical protein
MNIPDSHPNENTSVEGSYAHRSLLLPESVFRAIRVTCRTRCRLKANRSRRFALQLPFCIHSALFIFAIITLINPVLTVTQYTHIMEIAMPSPRRLPLQSKLFFTNSEASVSQTAFSEPAITQQCSAQTQLSMPLEADKDHRSNITRSARRFLPARPTERTVAQWAIDHDIPDRFWGKFEDRKLVDENLDDGITKAEFAVGCYSGLQSTESPSVQGPNSAPKILSTRDPVHKSNGAAEWDYERFLDQLKFLPVSPVEVEETAVNKGVADAGEAETVEESNVEESEGEEDSYSLELSQFQAWIGNSMTAHEFFLHEYAASQSQSNAQNQHQSKIIGSKPHARIVTKMHNTLKGVTKDLRNGLHRLIPAKGNRR